LAQLAFAEDSLSTLYEAEEEPSTLKEEDDYFDSDKVVMDTNSSTVTVVHRKENSLDDVEDIPLTPKNLSVTSMCSGASHLPESPPSPRYFCYALNLFCGILLEINYYRELSCISFRHLESQSKSAVFETTPKIAIYSYYVKAHFILTYPQPITRKNFDHYAGFCFRGVSDRETQYLVYLLLGAAELTRCCLYSCPCCL